MNFYLLLKILYIFFLIIFFGIGLGLVYYVLCVWCSG